MVRLVPLTVMPTAILPVWPLTLTVVELGAVDELMVPAKSAALSEVSFKVSLTMKRDTDVRLVESVNVKLMELPVPTLLASFTWVVPSAA